MEIDELDKTKLFLFLMGGIIILLIVSNLFMYQKINKIEEKKVDTITPTQPASNLITITATVKSIIGDSITIDHKTLDTPLTNTPETLLYIHRVMNDKEFQEAMEKYEEEVAALPEDQQTTILVPLKDSLLQVRTLDRLNLKAGDSVTVSVIQGEEIKLAGIIKES